MLAGPGMRGAETGLRLCARPGVVGRTTYKPTTAAIATEVSRRSSSLSGRAASCQSRLTQAGADAAWCGRACTVIAARGYGTGVGQYAVTTAGEMHGFPAVVTSFIGRAEAGREVADLLERHRLVTVTGPGGAGKTRLAGEVARRIADRFADGAWLVELAPIQDPAQVAAVVAAALGVREQPGAPAAEAVAQVLARQQLLLVVDNCEHLVGAAAELCAGLLTACDDVRVLATSREPLAVAGEVRYRLGPLDLARPDEADVGDWSEAVTLFVDRARGADAHFTVDDKAAAAVARLVQRLDGMPLAIELAAARVEALGVTPLLDRLDDRFALLAGGDRLAPERQRSLGAMVAWSYQLLDDQERRVFRAMSVFPGPFMLEAAEAVAGDAAQAAVLRLVDCSLLIPPRAGPDSRSRYAMLETLRAYGAGLLAEAGEQHGVAAGLAEYTLRVAEEAAPGLRTTSGELDAALRLDAEDATMRHVLAWARQHQPDIVLRLAAALGWWWCLRGRLAGEYPLLREVAARPGPGSRGWRAAQFWLGWTALFSADLPAALGHFDVLRDAVAGGPPSRALAEALAGRSRALQGMGRIPEAVDEAGRALAMARKLRYPAGELGALVALSLAASYAEDHHSAVRLARQAAQITSDIPGSTARACSTAMATILTEAGDLGAAESVCATGLALSRNVGDQWNLSALLGRMAVLDLRAGRKQDAAAHLREALKITSRASGRDELRSSLDCCGHLCAVTGRHAEALTVWAALAAFDRHEDLTDWPADARRREAAIRKARQALGQDRTPAAEDRGAAMSLDTVAQYALLLTAPGLPHPGAPPGLEKLSARERELITLVAQGRTDAQIAAQLYISVRTVHTHLDRIRDKTGCRRRADLTRLALTTGLV